MDVISKGEAPLGKRKRCRSKKTHKKNARNKQNGFAPEDLPQSAGEDALESETREAGIQAFRTYYRLQQVVPEEEFELLMRSLFKPLPVSFRLCSLPSRQDDVQAALSEAKSFLQDAVGEEGTERLHKFLPWCGAWQLKFHDRQLRQSAKLAPDSDIAKLSRWIVRCNDQGLLTRQEVVSMVPVAVLQVGPSHRVLDMCAAPGSKTTQALEAMCSQHTGQGPASGVVVANELVAKRAFVLSHRCTSLLGAAAASLLVTSHRAQIFPHPPKQRYDRVVCDVPCSGDGTFRKHRDKWAHWHPRLGRQLHSIQLQIALRAVRLLEVGGRMAYSTCSMNPLENEAVVCALLSRSNGALRLESCEGTLAGRHLQGFHTRPGLETWAVVDEEWTAWPSMSALSQHHNCQTRRTFRESMWPPKPGSKIAGSLNQCVRIYPHLQDTGGFFVALIKKVREWPPNSEGRKGKEGKKASHTNSSEPSLASPSLPTSPSASITSSSSSSLSSSSTSPSTLALIASQLGLDTASLRMGIQSPASPSQIGVLYGRSSSPRRVFLLSPAAAALMEDEQSHALVANGDEDDETTRISRPLRVLSGGVCVAELDKSCGTDQSGHARWHMTLAGSALLQTFAAFSNQTLITVSRSEACHLLKSSFHSQLVKDDISATLRSLPVGKLLFLQVGGTSGLTLPGRVVVNAEGEKAAVVTISKSDRLHLPPDLVSKASEQ